MAERKIVAYNRKASHDYFLEDRFEAGLELQGTEIKSVRNGKVQLKDAYISFVNNEAFVKEMHISPYTYGNRFNHEETRIRKLLLHRDEIRKLQQKVQLKGYTVVPLSVYLASWSSQDGDRTGKRKEAARQAQQRKRTGCKA